ncbi:MULTISPECIES: acyltransferase family protein [unclassified Thermosipho (in: thermotogales)]|uniref:acyltransferase family protein n=1 Tax=unclassified Thermosipho (in: thermotogales) TaxID=2676525 RepID=UPI000985C22C|nr:MULTISPECIES: acyltransferase family protein [unclassified Thermosipho (in: thermotogales)]MBT1248626.1 acyltransferase [Thermosipho sp. 1244]OOC47293.1 acyltransferase [Thermosipho sp. 1223]
MRIKEIDIAKGFLMVLIIFAHSYAPERYVSYVSNVLASFMFISGFLFKEETFSLKLKKIFFNILVPFYFMATIGYFLYFAINKVLHLTTDVFYTFFDFIIFGYAPIDIPVNVLPLWYLYMFSIAEICFVIFVRLKVTYLIPLFSILSTILVNVQTKFFKLEVVFHGLVWFYLGWLFKRKGFNFKVKKPLLLLGISGFLIFLLTGLNGFNDWREANYGNYPLISYVVEFFTLIFVISFSNLVVSRKIEGFFMLFGKFTLFVLGYHIVIPGLFMPLIKDPLLFLEKFWLLNYFIMVFFMYLIIRFVPKRLLYFLSGQFYIKKASG